MKILTNSRIEYSNCVFIAYRCTYKNKSYLVTVKYLYNNVPTPCSVDLMRYIIMLSNENVYLITSLYDMICVR